MFELIPTEDLEPLGLELDDEPSIQTQQLITRKLRTTISHLRSYAGFFSCFRGLSIYICTEVLFMILIGLMRTLRFIPNVVAAIIATVLLSTFRMGWTWIVISKPSNKLWFRRLPSIRLWTKIAIPTALAAICEVIASALPIYAIFLFNLVNENSLDLSKMGGVWELLALIKVLTVFAIYLFCSVAFVIPPRVMLIRVQASLLPESEETIIPVDRSFGGSGVIGMIEAWKTFDWNSRVRLLKLYGKIAAMEVALFFFCIVVIGAEMMILLPGRT